MHDASHDAAEIEKDEPEIVDDDDLDNSCD